MIADGGWLMAHSSFGVEGNVCLCLTDSKSRKLQEGCKASGSRPF